MLGFYTMDVGHQAKPINPCVPYLSLSLLPSSLQYSLFQFDFNSNKLNLDPFKWNDIVYKVKYIMRIAKSLV